MEKRNENDRVAKKWSQQQPTPQDCNFNMSPVFARHKISLAFGDSFAVTHCDNPHFAEDIFVEKYLRQRKIRSVLSLCCGFGRIERRIVAQLGTVERCIGVDVAKGALAAAQQAAADENLDCISYICADLNVWDWGREKFDLIIAYGALHHLKNLDKVLDGVYDSLSPEGLLFSHEYVGLPYCACAPRQLQLINAIAYLVPAELRMRRGFPLRKPEMLFRLFSKLGCASSGYFDNNWPMWKKIAVRMVAKIWGRTDDGDFGYVTLSPHNLVKRMDPSEGVSAPLIIPALQSRFDSVDVMHSGGALLEHALDNRFYAAFDAANPCHRQLADLLWNLERFYTEAGEIGPHNVYLVASKK